MSQIEAIEEWQVGDLVLWDNRCTMHCATGGSDSNGDAIDGSEIRLTAPEVGSLSHYLQGIHTSLPVDMENLPLLTGFYTSQVVGPGISEPSTVALAPWGVSWTPLFGRDARTARKLLKETKQFLHVMGDDKSSNHHRLPETNSKNPLKMDDWNTILFYWGKFGLFSGAFTCC